MSDALRWSPEAEQAVLGSLLLDNRAFDRATGLGAEHFFDPRHGAIWTAIAGTIVAHKPADIFTVVEALGSSAEDAGGLAYLNSLASSVPSAANIRRYVEIVREKAGHRALMDTADSMLTIAAEAGPVAEKVDRMTTMLGEIQRQQVQRLPRALSDIAIERTQHYEDVQAGNTVPGWPTHIPRLDRMLNGGIKPGKLYILAARPSVGKSSFSQAIGLNLAGDGHPTLFLSQEMDSAEVADRGVSSIGRISYSALLTGRMDPEDWNRASEALDKLQRLPFYVDDQASLRLLDIRAKARSCKNLQVIVLDYLQLCAGSRKDGNRNAEIEEISRGLKTLAKEMDVAVIALSQLNRNVETRAGRRPNLSDLRDSGAIEQDADVVLFLWPVRELGEGHRIVGLGIDKNRQGKTGEFGLDFFGDVQRWHESTADIHPPPAPPGRQQKGFE